MSSSGRKTWIVPDLDQTGHGYGSKESINSDKPPHWFEVTKVRFDIFLRFQRV